MKKENENYQNGRTREQPMNNNEKREFLEVINKTADLYDKKIPKERIAVYWDALAHRSMDDIKSAINRHIQDSERGRFFPLPADISAQLPNELNAWLNANEAWAACPKDEYSSVAMCEEIGQALHSVQDLIENGDTIAARMAFIEHYNRLVEDAKREGRKPQWFPSYGFDKENRYIADRKVIEYKNMALPSGQKLALPEPENVKQVEYKDTQKVEVKSDPVKASDYIAGLKDILKKPCN